MGALATWRCSSGINAFWPLAGMQVVHDGGGNPVIRPAPNTYLFGDGPGNYATLAEVPDTWHFRSTVLQQVRAAGFDHIRLQYEPTPIIWALMHDDTELLDFVLSQFDISVNAIMGAGLGCVLSGILTGYADLMLPRQALAGLASEGYDFYKQHLLLLGERYADRDPTLFALELLNEPPGNGSTTVRPPGYFNWGVLYTGDWQTDYQPDLYAALRAVMPDHTMLLTCDGWSNWEILKSYDPSPYASDTNIIWQYHPLEPTPASLSGYIYNQYFYVQRLAYPPGANRLDASAGTLAGSIAAMEALVDKYPNVATGGNPAATKAGLEFDLGSYYGSPENFVWIKARIDALTEWARENGTAPGNLYAGEHGATRDSTGFPGNLLGLAFGSKALTRLDRIHLYRDMSRAILVNGHRRAPDHLDTLNYGITYGQNLTIGAFDRLIIHALAPRRRWLQAA